MEKTKQIVGKGTAWLTTAIISFFAFIMILMAGESYIIVGLMAWLTVLSMYMLGESAKEAKE